MHLEQHGDVFVLTMDNGENRFNPTSLGEISDHLDTVVAHASSPDTPCALVTTGSGKFFSNGLDLDWMVRGEAEDPMAMVSDMMRMWARVMSLPMPTVAAVNGHAFAGGAMFTLAHDHVLMRSDRGYWCVNEAVLRMRLTPGMQAILSGRLPAPTARQAILTARRFGAASALDGGIVDAVHSEEQLIPAAIERAQSLAHMAHPVLTALKEDLYADILPVLRRAEGPAAF